jgi:intracellular sulfur oxidation DsrE/DsrF family protein
MSELKVVIHVNEPERWKKALGNIRNLIIDLGETKADIVALANGSAVVTFGDPEVVEAMRILADKGVHFIACRNSLKNMCAEGVICLSESELPSFVAVTTAGITELVKRQHQGYAYVKP